MSLDTLLYVAESDNPLFDDLKCQGSVTRQQIWMEVELPESKDADTFEREISAWELHTQEGTRTTPTKIQRMDSVGEVIQFKVTFEPIHSRRVFQELGLRGNLNQQYLLSLDGKNTTSIKCSLSTESFEASIRNYGLSERVGYSIKIPELLHQSLMESSDSTHSFQSLENEILYQGLWLRIQSYHQGDSLITRLRMVNQSGLAVEADLSKAEIVMDDVRIQSSTKNLQRFVISNGRRAEVRLAYLCPQKDNYGFDLSGFRFPDAPSAKQIFPFPLVLRKNI